jgi:hypothetical protein
MGMFDFLKPGNWTQETIYFEIIPIDFAPKMGNKGASLYAGPQGSLAGSLPSWIAPWGEGIAYQKGHVVFYDLSRADRGTVAKGQSVSLNAYSYNENNLYVKTSLNFDFDDSGSNGPQLAEGWKTFADLKNDGWDVGYGHGNSIQLFSATSTSAQTPDVRYDQVVLNLSDVHSSLAANTFFVVCGSVMKPPLDGNLAEFPLVPSDRVTIGGGILRSPVEVSGLAGSHKVISGDYPTIVAPTIMFKPKTAYEEDGLADINFTAWEALSSDDERNKYESYQFSEYGLMYDGLKNKKVPTFHPQYAEGRTSLRAYLSSSYRFATPMAENASVEAWESGKSYKIGSPVAHALTSSDENIQPAGERESKDIIWICVKDHNSETANNPPVLNESNYWTHDYWRPYGLVMNSPNSSISLLWDSYKDSNEIKGASSITETGLSGIPGSSLRKRMSDMIGGSRLYANLTISPSKKGTSVKVAARKAGYGRGRSHPIYALAPPGGIAGRAEEDGARADLWLYPNTLKKDHAGQVRYAVQFGDVTTFSPVKLKQGFFTRFLFSWMFWKAFSRKWSAMPARRDPSEYVKLIKGLTTQDTAASRSASRLTSAYGFLMGNDPLDLEAELPGRLSGEQEIDILRFQFTALKPWHYYANMTTVNGMYSVIVEDLNSGNLLSTTFSYKQIALKGPSSELDEYGHYRWGSGRDQSMNQNVEYNAKYREEADKIVKLGSTNDPEGSSLRLIATRNYFNYVLLGHVKPSGSGASSDGLIISSMDMSEDQFTRCIGLMQTGFGGITLLNEEDPNDDTTVSKGQLKTVVDKNMLHVLEIPPSVDNGNFIVGDDINASSSEYIAKLKGAASSWEGSKYYDASTVVKYGGKYYFALKCHTSPSSFSPGDNWKEIDQIDYKVKKPSSLDNSISTKDAWGHLLNSTKLSNNERLVFGFDWAPSVSPSTLPAFFLGMGAPGQNFSTQLASLYNPGALISIERNIPFDGPGLLYVSSANVTAPNGLTGWYNSSIQSLDGKNFYAYGQEVMPGPFLALSRLEFYGLGPEERAKYRAIQGLTDIQDNSRFLYKLKKPIYDVNASGVVPGYVHDPNWIVLPGFSSDVANTWWSTVPAQHWRNTTPGENYKVEPEAEIKWEKPDGTEIAETEFLALSEDDQDLCEVTSPVFGDRIKEILLELEPNKNWKGSWTANTSYEVSDISIIQFEIKDGDDVVDFQTIVMECITQHTSVEKPFRLDLLGTPNFTAVSTNSSLANLLYQYGEDPENNSAGSLPVDTEYWEFVPSSSGDKSHISRSDSSFLFPAKQGLFGAIEFYKSMNTVVTHNSINSKYNANVRNVTPAMTFLNDGNLPEITSITAANSASIPGSPPLVHMLTAAEGGSDVAGTWPDGNQLTKGKFAKSANGTFNTGNTFIDNLLIFASGDEIGFDFQQVVDSGQASEVEDRITFLRVNPGFGPEGTFMETSFSNSAITPRILKHKEMDINLYSRLKVVLNDGSVGNLTSSEGKNFECAIVCLSKTDKEGIDNHNWTITDASETDKVNPALTGTYKEIYRERNKLIPFNCTATVETDDLSKVLLAGSDGYGYLDTSAARPNQYVTINEQRKRVVTVEATYFTVDSDFQGPLENEEIYGEDWYSTNNSSTDYDSNDHGLRVSSTGGDTFDINNEFNRDKPFGEGLFLKFFPRAASHFFSGFGSQFYGNNDLHLIAKLNLNEGPSRFEDKSHTYQIGTLIYDKNSKRDDAIVQFYLNNLTSDLARETRDEMEAEEGEPGMSNWFDFQSSVELIRNGLIDRSGMTGMENLAGIEYASKSVREAMWVESGQISGLTDPQRRADGMTSLDVSFSELTFVTKPYFALNPPNYIKDSNGGFRYFFYNGIDSGLEVKVKIPLLSESAELLADAGQDKGYIKFNSETPVEIEKSNTDEGVVLQPYNLTSFGSSISTGTALTIALQDDIGSGEFLTGNALLVDPPSITSFGSAYIHDQYWFYSSANDTYTVTASYPANLVGTFEVGSDSEPTSGVTHSYLSLTKLNINNNNRINFKLSDGLNLPLNNNGDTFVEVEKGATLIGDTLFASEPANFIGGTMYFYSGRDDEYTYTSSFGVSGPFVASATISPAGSSPAVLNKVKKGDFLNSSLVNGGLFSLTISDGTGLNDTYGTAKIEGTAKRIDPVSTPVITIPAGEVGGWGSCSTGGYNNKVDCEDPAQGNGTWTPVPGLESVKYLSPDAFTVRASYADTGFSDFPLMGSLKLEVTNRAGAIDESTIGPIDFDTKTVTGADYEVNSTSFGGDINLQVTISDGILDSTNLGLDRVATSGPYRIASRPNADLKPDYSIRADGSGNQLRWWAHKDGGVIKSEVHVSISNDSFLLHPSAYGDDRLQKSVVEVTDLASNTKPLDTTYDGSANEFLNSIEFFPASQENPLARFQAQLGDGQETLGQMVNWLQGEHPNTGVKTVVFGQVDLSLVGQELLEGSPFARSEVPETVFLNAPGNVYVGDDLFIMSRNPGYQELNWKPPNKQMLGLPLDLYAHGYGGPYWWDEVGEREALCADEDGYVSGGGTSSWSDGATYPPGSEVWDDGTWWRNDSGETTAPSSYSPGNQFIRGFTVWTNIFSERQPYTQRRDFDIIDHSDLYGENVIEALKFFLNWSKRPYKAFFAGGWYTMLRNDNTSSGPFTEPPFPHYFTVKFDQKWRISKYKVEVDMHYSSYTLGVQGGYPTDWKLQASDDGVTWVDLHTVTNSAIPGWTHTSNNPIFDTLSAAEYLELDPSTRGLYENELKTFEVDSNSTTTDGYLYFRFYITKASNGHAHYGGGNDASDRAMRIPTFEFHGTPYVAQFYGTYLRKWHVGTIFSHGAHTRHFIPIKNPTHNDGRGNWVHFYANATSTGEIPGDAPPSLWEKFGVTWHTTHDGGADTPSSVLRIAGRHDIASPVSDTYVGVWPIIDGEPLALDAPLVEETAILLYNAYRAPGQLLIGAVPDPSIGYADASGLAYWVALGGEVADMIDGLNIEGNGVTFEIIEGASERATHQIQGHPASDSAGVNFPKNIALQYDFENYLHISSNTDLLTHYNNYVWDYLDGVGTVDANSKSAWDFGESHYERHGWYEGRLINKIFKANMEFESAHEGGNGQDTAFGGYGHYDHEEDMPYLALVHQNNSLINNYENLPWVSQYLDGLSIGEEYKVTLYDQEWLSAVGSQMLVTIESVDGANFEFERTSGITSDEWGKWSFTFTANMKDPYIKLVFTGGASSTGAWLIRGLKVERTYKIDDVEVFEIEAPEIDSPITAMDCGEIDGIKAFHSGSKGTLSAYMGDYKLFGSNDIWQELDSNGEAIPGLAPNWFDDPSESEYNYSWVRPYFKLGSITVTTSSSNPGLYNWSSDITNALVQYPLTEPTAWDYHTKIGTWSNFDPPLKQTLQGWFGVTLVPHASPSQDAGTYLRYQGSNDWAQAIKIESTMRADIADAKLALYDGIGKLTLENDAWGVHANDIDNIAIIRPGEINLYPDWEPGVLYKKGEGMRVGDLFDGNGEQYYVCAKDHMSTNDDGAGLSSSYAPYVQHYVDADTKELTSSARGVLGWGNKEWGDRFRGGYYSGNRGSPLYWVRQEVARPHSTWVDFRWTGLGANASYSSEGLDELAAFMKEKGFWETDKIGDLQSGEKLVEIGSDLYKRVLTRVGSNKSRILFAESPSSAKASIVQVDLSPSRDVDEWNTYPSMVAPFTNPSLIYFGDASAGGILGDELVSSIDVSDLDYWKDTADPFDSGKIGERLNRIIKKENLSLLIVDDYVGGDEERYSSVFVYCPPKPSLKIQDAKAFYGSPWQSTSSDATLSALRWDWWSEDEDGSITGSASAGGIDRNRKMGMVSLLFADSDYNIREDRYPSTDVRNQMFISSDMLNVWKQEFGRAVDLTWSTDGTAYDIGSFENIDWGAKYFHPEEGDFKGDHRNSTGRTSYDTWGLSEGGRIHIPGSILSSQVENGDWGYIQGHYSNFDRNALMGWLKWDGLDSDNADVSVSVPTANFEYLRSFVPDYVATDPEGSFVHPSFAINFTTTGRIWRPVDTTGMRYGGWDIDQRCNGLLLIKNGSLLGFPTLSEWGGYVPGGSGVPPDSGVGTYIVGLQSIGSKPNSISTSPQEFKPLGVMYRVSVKVAIPTGIPLAAGRLGHLTPSQSVRFDAFVDLSGETSGGQSVAEKMGSWDIDHTDFREYAFYFTPNGDHRIRLQNSNLDPIVTTTPGTNGLSCTGFSGQSILLFSDLRVELCSPYHSSREKIYPTAFTLKGTCQINTSSEPGEPPFQHPGEIGNLPDSSIWPCDPAFTKEDKLIETSFQYPHIKEYVHMDPAYPFGDPDQRDVEVGSLILHEPPTDMDANGNTGDPLADTGGRRVLYERNGAGVMYKPSHPYGWDSSLNGKWTCLEYEYDNPEPLVDPDRVKCISKIEVQDQTGQTTGFEVDVYKRNPRRSGFESGAFTKETSTVDATSHSQGRNRFDYPGSAITSSDFHSFEEGDTLKFSIDASSPNQFFPNYFPYFGCLEPQGQGSAITEGPREDSMYSLTGMPLDLHPVDLEVAGSTVWKHSGSESVSGEYPDGAALSGVNGEYYWKKARGGTSGTPASFVQVEVNDTPENVGNTSPGGAADYMSHVLFKKYGTSSGSWIKLFELRFQIVKSDGTVFKFITNPTTMLDTYNNLGWHDISDYRDELDFGETGDRADFKKFGTIELHKVLKEAGGTHQDVHSFSMFTTSGPPTTTPSDLTLRCYAINHAAMTLRGFTGAEGYYGEHGYNAQSLRNEREVYPYSYGPIEIPLA